MRLERSKSIFITGALYRIYRVNCSKRRKGEKGETRAFRAGAEERKRVSDILSCVIFLLSGRARFALIVPTKRINIATRAELFALTFVPSLPVGNCASPIARAELGEVANSP